ncbi:hypothetical protein AG1IA_08999 [Rhizoctonia solani AG-1 IA]|uniref:Uncharacterized protein n=1 Tax=Thanatephorus cucumeris (strain AG1-IA) TaxID=983506 RepID=L8WFK9_THACA|nr:hypothetical protein AG1IA_08999 [Rhizoctonia solani AG-1 IA]
MKSSFIPILSACSATSCLNCQLGILYSFTNHVLEVMWPNELEVGELRIFK